MDETFAMHAPGVYLIHFRPAYRHAAHYLGFAKDVARRLEKHRNGTGARLTQVAVDAGSELILARVWWGRGRKFERKLKNRKCSPRYCPICQAEEKAG